MIVRVLGTLVAALLVAPLAKAADAPGWPRQISHGGETITLYDPQYEALKGNTLTARAAFSVQAEGAEPTFGALWMVSNLQINRDAHTVQALDAKITRVRLPGADEARAQALQDVINKEISGWGSFTNSYEKLMTGLESEDRARASVADLKHDPPTILFTQEPTVLVAFEGAPELKPIEGSTLTRAVNTPMLVVRDQGTGRFYLSGGTSWYTADDALGPWKPAASVPPEVAKLVPPEQAKKAAENPEGAAELKSPPRIQTATVPTELVVTDGTPDWQPLVGGDLLFVKNSEGDVLKEVSTQSIWVLLGGRWYKSQSERGPWTYVRGDQLPASFARIPPESPRGNLLAFVAGTEEAQDAVMDAQIPQTAAIKRDAKPPPVTYDGPPSFEAAATGVEYAKNTPQQILRINGKYYLCQDGVWWVSDDANKGWVVADHVPDEIQSIPPSNPDYNTRYVQVYDSNADNVYVGYTPGYQWSYPYYGTIVYGTGWPYAPWNGAFYYPQPYWWGIHAYYNPWWGWGFGYSYCHGFYHAGYHYGYGHGYYHGHGGWYGPGGFHGARVVNHYTTVTHTGGGRPVGPAATNLYGRQATKAWVANPRTNAGGHAPKAGHGINDAMTDRGGNVYRRGSGGWKVTTPGATAQQKGARGSPEWHEMARQHAAARENRYRAGGYGGVRPNGGGGQKGGGAGHPSGGGGGGGHGSTGHAGGGGHGGGGHGGKR